MGIVEDGAGRTRDDLLDITDNRVWMRRDSPRVRDMFRSRQREKTTTGGKYWIVTAFESLLVCDLIN